MPKGKGNRKPIPAEDVAADYAAGATIREIAWARGVSPGVIQRRLREAGVERRRPGPATRPEAPAC